MVQPYDLVMLVVLVAAAAWGAYKGVAWQIASLAAFVVSYFVALQFSATLAPYISETEPINRYVAMFVLYTGTSMAIWVAFRYVHATIDRVQLKEFDRQIGAIFGAAKGVLLCLVVTFFAVTLTADSRDMVLHARSGYYITKLIHGATPVIPPELHESIGPYLERLDQGLDPNRPTIRTAADVDEQEEEQEEFSDTY